VRVTEDEARNRVIDLSLFSRPYLTSCWPIGAEVIKVEPPGERSDGDLRTKGRRRDGVLPQPQPRKKASLWI
jgi:crotonobetainyl-CoA:carnitine CoA-transferase CaiB-like acyl-CoA transferase